MLPVHRTFAPYSSRLLRTHTILPVLLRVLYIAVHAVWLHTPHTVTFATRSVTLLPLPPHLRSTLLHTAHYWLRLGCFCARMPRLRLPRARGLRGLVHAVCPRCTYLPVTRCLLHAVSHLPFTWLLVRCGCLCGSVRVTRLRYTVTLPHYPHLRLLRFLRLPLLLVAVVPGLPFCRLRTPLVCYLPTFAFTVLRLRTGYAAVAFGYSRLHYTLVVLVLVLHTTTVLRFGLVGSTAVYLRGYRSFSATTAAYHIPLHTVVCGYNRLLLLRSRFVYTTTRSVLRLRTRLRCLHSVYRLCGCGSRVTRLHLRLPHIATFTVGLPFGSGSTVTAVHVPHHRTRALVRYVPRTFAVYGCGYTHYVRICVLAVVAVQFLQFCTVGFLLLRFPHIYVQFCRGYAVYILLVRPYRTCTRYVFTTFGYLPLLTFGCGCYLPTGWVWFLRLPHARLHAVYTVRYYRYGSGYAVRATLRTPLHTRTLHVTPATLRVTHFTHYLRLVACRGYTPTRFTLCSSIRAVGSGYRLGYVTACLRYLVWLRSFYFVLVTVITTRSATFTRTTLHHAHTCLHVYVCRWLHLRCVLPAHHWIDFTAFMVDCPVLWVTFAVCYRLHTRVYLSTYRLRIRFWLPLLYSFTTRTPFTLHTTFIRFYVRVTCGSRWFAFGCVTVVTRRTRGWVCYWLRSWLRLVYCYGWLRYPCSCTVLRLRSVLRLAVKLLRLPPRSVRFCCRFAHVHTHLVPFTHTHGYIRYGSAYGYTHRIRILRFVLRYALPPFPVAWTHFAVRTARLVHVYGYYRVHYVRYGSTLPPGSRWLWFISVCLLPRAPSLVCAHTVALPRGLPRAARTRLPRRGLRFVLPFTFTRLVYHLWLFSGCVTYRCGYYVVTHCALRGSAVTRTRLLPFGCRLAVTRTFICYGLPLPHITFWFGYTGSLVLHAHTPTRTTGSRAPLLRSRLLLLFTARHARVVTVYYVRLPLHAAVHAYYTYAGWHAVCARGLRTRCRLFTVVPAVGSRLPLRFGCCGCWFAVWLPAVARFAVLRAHAHARYAHTHCGLIIYCCGYVTACGCLRLVGYTFAWLPHGYRATPPVIPQLPLRLLDYAVLTVLPVLVGSVRSSCVRFCGWLPHRLPQFPTVHLLHHTHLLVTHAYARYVCRAYTLHVYLRFCLRALPVTFTRVHALPHAFTVCRARGLHLPTAARWLCRLVVGYHIRSPVLTTTPAVTHTRYTHVYTLLHTVYVPGLPFGLGSTIRRSTLRFTVSPAVAVCVTHTLRLR